MIRVSLAMVKQASLWRMGVSASTRISRASSTKRRNGGRSAVAAPPSLLPATDLPNIARADLGNTGELDAILAIVPETGAKGLFDRLPESERWQELNARSKPRSGTVRTTVLANRRQTLAVLGYVGAQASTFERLSLAGRMLKEVSSRSPETLGLIVLGEAAAAREAMDALLAASLAQAFHLPVFRKPANDEKSIRRLVVLNEPGAGADSSASVATADSLAYALAAARGNNLVRWLTALPPNMLDSPGYHSAIARLARKNGLGMRWLDEKALRREGANAFLAVCAANERRDAGIAHLTYRPPRNKSTAPDVALVGKGILFDTGGVNLKPHRSMLDMHTDMSGSAVALATLLALAELEAPIAVDAWLAVTENQIGPKAYRPQEVVRASNGVTIQVIHTDAEGRMVLADTLALAGRTRPRFMIDFATLTGAAVYSLTERMSGVLTNRQDLLPKLVEAGRTSGERVWNFPFDADYDTDLESKVADILQCSVDGKGDHILATRFLSRFVPEHIPWAHVDLSAATRTGGLAHINTDITGFGVRYALELILKHDILAGLERRK
jgi:leucyl aminopeptidase